MVFVVGILILNFWGLFGGLFWGFFLFVCLGFSWQSKTSSDLGVDVSGACMFFLCHYTSPLLKCLRVDFGLTDLEPEC